MNQSGHQPQVCFPEGALTSWGTRCGRSPLPSSVRPAPAPSPGLNTHFRLEEGLRVKGGCSAREGRWRLPVLSSPLTFVLASLPPQPRSAGGGRCAESRVSCAEGPLGTKTVRGCRWACHGVRIEIQVPGPSGPRRAGLRVLGDLSLPTPSPVPIKSQERCQLEARQPRPLGMSAARMT